MPPTTPARQPQAIDACLGAWFAPQPVFEAWFRSVDGLLEATLATQDALLAAGRDLANAQTREQRRALGSWLDATQAAQPKVLEMWRAIAEQGDRLAQDIVTELRYSAVDLLEQLGRERAAREQVEQQRQQHAQHAEREFAERRRAEQERDQARVRAEQAEAACQRLEREVARERERAARAEQALAQAQAEPPAVSVVRREDEWAVVREGAQRASAVFDTKGEAVERAREIARHDSVELHLPAPQTGPARDAPPKSRRTTKLDND